MDDGIKQVGNIYPDTEGFKNKTSGRVYNPDGIAPTLNTADGGGEHPTSSRRLLRQIPRNTDAEGNARCIKAGYYKMGGQISRSTKATDSLQPV